MTYLFPPIAQFEIINGKISEGFEAYKSKPYICKIYELKNKYYVCVWKYDKDKKLLIGAQGQYQPYEIKRNCTL